MKTLYAIFLILATPVAAAQIYRCDTPQGTVFSEDPCGENAREVTIDDESSGISIAPPEAVSEYLAQAQMERAEAREEALERARQEALMRPPAPPPVYTTDYPTGYPVYWPRRPHHRPPHHRPPGQRPDRPSRPTPEPAPTSTLRPID